jgi:hypothetical protein
MCASQYIQYYIIILSLQYIWDLKISLVHISSTPSFAFEDSTPPTNNLLASIRVNGLHSAMRIQCAFAASILDPAFRAIPSSRNISAMSSLSLFKTFLCLEDFCH